MVRRLFRFVIHKFTLRNWYWHLKRSSSIWSRVGGVIGSCDRKCGCVRMSMSQQKVPICLVKRNLLNQSHGQSLSSDGTWSVSRPGLCRNPYPLFIYCESPPTSTISSNYLLWETSPELLKYHLHRFPGNGITHSLFTCVTTVGKQWHTHTQSLTHSLTHSLITLQLKLQHTHTHTRDGPPLGIGESSYTHQLVSDQHHWNSQMEHEGYKDHKILITKGM